MIEENIIEEKKKKKAIYYNRKWKIIKDRTMIN